MTPAQRKNFARLLRPRHIAFIGGHDATIAINEARRRGFGGQMWAVNPKRSDLAGVTCLPSIADLREPPDAVYLAIPANGVVAALGELAKLGAGGVVCFSAGFKETGDQAAEQALIDATGDMALIGPNCYGLINYIDNSALWSFEHGGWSPGYGAAIVTQSGMFSSDITMSARSLPMAYMVSAGNQAVLGLEDFLDIFCEDDAVRAIGLHIEGLTDIQAFERAALKAIEKGVAVVALKTGRSAIGATLTVSHTGSLSGSNELYEALFARTGVISVTNPAQFLETLKYLCVAGAPGDRNVAGFTCSGGGATMLADHAETINLSFAPIAQQDHATLKNLLPDIATVSNPLDYTTPIWGQPDKTYPVFSQAMDVMSAGSAVLVQDYPAKGLDDSKCYYQHDAAAFGKAAAERGLPAAICATIPENLDEDTRRFLIDQGIAPMQGIHETLNAIGHAATWQYARKRVELDRPAPLLSAKEPYSTRLLTEDEGKAMLMNFGVQIPAGTTVSEADARSQAADFNYPVVLKMMSPNLAHKTEAGAVVLNITGPNDLIDKIACMKNTVKAYDMGAKTDSFLIEEMSPTPLAELIVTLRSDPQFGSVLVLGSGGILTELVGDAVTVLLPATSKDIEQALQSLRTAKLLGGFRGRPKANFARMSDQIHKICSSYVSHQSEIFEIEINPMFVYQEDMVAIDALIQVVAS